MKRSEINDIIRQAILFFAEQGFSLPPFAFFHEEDWRKHLSDGREIFDLQLGWDVTAFGSDDFNQVGLTLFTLRNGKMDAAYPKPYAEKIMMVGEGQVTPRHFHWQKREDIINRGGGNLVMEIWKAGRDNRLTEEYFEMVIDGLRRTMGPGERLVLQPGQSVCFEPYIAHRFWGEPGEGRVLVGEVSMVNDDSQDNCFIDGQPRFDAIEEDESPCHLLASDYPKLLED